MEGPRTTPLHIAGEIGWFSYGVIRGVPPGHVPACR